MVTSAVRSATSSQHEPFRSEALHEHYCFAGRVLETVPAEELSKAQEVMRVIREKLTEVDAASKDLAPASDAAPDPNLKLFLPKT